METLWESTQSILLCKKPFSADPHTAVDINYRAIDVRGILVTQENDRAGNVFRYAKAEGLDLKKNALSSSLLFAQKPLIRSPLITVPGATALIVTPIGPISLEH